MRRLLAPSTAARSSFSLSAVARAVLFCARWIRKTMRKVMTVVAVLITSCHVSEKWNSGPVINQTTMAPRARTKAPDEPVQSLTTAENFSMLRAYEVRVPFIRSPLSPRASSKKDATTKGPGDSLLAEASFVSKKRGPPLRGVGWVGNRPVPSEGQWRAPGSLHFLESG